MDNNKIMVLDTNPWFDIEEFMSLAREKRIDGSTMQKLMSLWEDWLGKLQVKRIEHPSGSWLAVWLPEEVERLVDETWDKSPSFGYLVNNLAQYLCMAAVHDLLPQVADGGCAPSPRQSPEFHSALNKAGLGSMEQTGALARRYAVATNYPYKGGCEICALQEACPRGGGGDGFQSILLPGYERANRDNS